MRTIFLCLLFGISAQVAVHAADPVGDKPKQIAIGWRGDGYSGVMPPDCKPPKDFNGVTGKNLRWN